MPTNYVIRKVMQQDNKPIAHLIRKVFIEFDAPKEGTVYSDKATDYLFEYFDTNNAALFVLEEKGEIAGVCGIYPTLGLPKSCIEIVKFYIRPESRGQGFGFALFNTCQLEAKAKGYSQLYLESIPDFKTAVNLYLKLGFTQLDKRLGETGHFGCDLWFSKSI
ncbi:GNAT family N-acetyltransferase [Putridiphycobacter roseus]|uniref:GNAT family N-acetyltransferase n=2 Tax=Putridiphycobacter roseus TaxID=2219161 RepID=A0A2W1NES7_9FLAO|nr:GNAT family N-acetyltransferase [Putridiphycobacter roseus]